MNYKILIVALSLSAAGAAFVPATSATDDPYWYCDTNPANDPNTPGNPGNHANDLGLPGVDFLQHTFGGASGVGVTQNGATMSAGGVIAYSADDATNGACAPSEVALTDGDGEWEAGINGAIFSVTDETNCGGYGNGHHGLVRDAGAVNVALEAYLSFSTGTDGPVHAADIPETPEDERTTVPDECLGNGVVANDPATDGYDCSSNTGYSLDGGVVVWATPTPVDPVLSGGVCDSVDDTQPLFLDTGVTFTGGPEVEGIAHSAYVLTVPEHLHPACAQVTGVYEDEDEGDPEVDGTYYVGTQGDPSNEPEWHTQCAVYLGVTNIGVTLGGVSVPIEGLAFLR